MNTIVVASICPYPLRFQRRFCRYEIQAAEWKRPLLGASSIVPATVTMKDETDQIDAGDDHYYPQPIPVQDLVADWARDDELKEGLFACNGKRPLKEEIEAAVARRQQWNAGLIQQGDYLWERTHRHEHISDAMRRACSEMGVKREWGTKLLRMIECPACGEDIRGSAAWCRHCSCVIDEAAYNRLKFHAVAPHAAQEAQAV